MTFTFCSARKLTRSVSPSSFWIKFAVKNDELPLNEDDIFVSLKCGCYFTFCCPDLIDFDEQMTV